MVPLRSKRLGQKREESCAHPYALADLHIWEQSRGLFLSPNLPRQSWVLGCPQGHLSEAQKQPYVIQASTTSVSSSMPSSVSPTVRQPSLATRAWLGRRTSASSVQSYLNRIHTAYKHNWKMLLLKVFFRTTSLIMTYISMDSIDIRCSETKTFSFPDINTVNTDLHLNGR